MEKERKEETQEGQQKAAEKGAGNDDHDDDDLLIQEVATVIMDKKATMQRKQSPKKNNVGAVVDEPPALPREDSLVKIVRGRAEEARADICSAQATLQQSTSISSKQEARHYEDHNDVLHKEAAFTNRIPDPQSVDDNSTGNRGGHTMVEEPGAYAVGGPNLESAQTDEQVVTGDEEAPPLVGMDNSDANSGLVEALPVQPIEVSGHAIAVDLEEASPKVSQDTPLATRNNIIGGIFVGILLLTGIALGLSLGLSQSEAGNRKIPDETIDTIPTVANNTNLTTVLPALVIADLPNFTLQSLADPDSPQSQAWHWLETHRELLGMPEWRKRQLLALGAFYYSFGGPKWPFGLNEDWLDDSKSECEWYSGMYGSFYSTSNKDAAYEQTASGYTCSETGEFETIVLTQGEKWGFALDTAPSMPLELSFLTALKQLELGGNGSPGGMLQSILPLEVTSALSNLEMLRIHTEDFEGAIPSEIGLLTNLKDLGLFKLPKTTGTLPSEIFMLSKLAYLQVYKTGVTGTLSSEFGTAMPDLEVLDLWKNNYTQSIPTELGQATSLRRLYLQENYLTGFIPSELGLLSSLQKLDLQGNLLEGAIPEALGSPSSLFRNINLTGNPYLSGQVPNSLCDIGGGDPTCSFVFAYRDKESTFSCGLEFTCTALLCGCGCGC